MVSLKIVDDELVQEVCFVLRNLNTLSEFFDNSPLVAPVDVKTVSGVAIHPEKFNDSGHLCRKVFLEMGWAVTFPFVAQTAFTL